jgi:RNA polymerase sigma factor (sigma-70 family)
VASVIRIWVVAASVNCNEFAFAELAKKTQVDTNTVVGGDSLPVEKRNVVSDLSCETLSEKMVQPQLDSSIDWAQVTSLIIAGDQAAFETYYNHYFEPMLKMAKRFSGFSTENCLDLVHDAMLKAGKGMRPIADSRSLDAWTRAVMQSVCLDRLRKKTRERNFIRQQLESGETEKQGYSGADDNVARIAWIESSVENLPADLQQLFSWRFRLGWSLKAIGRQLGISTGAVDGRMRRAIEKLREQAIQEFGDEF